MKNDPTLRVSGSRASITIPLRRRIASTASRTSATVGCAMPRALEMRDDVGVASRVGGPGRSRNVTSQTTNRPASSRLESAHAIREAAVAAVSVDAASPSARSNTVTRSIVLDHFLPYAPTFWIGVPPTVPGMPDRHSTPGQSARDDRRDHVVPRLAGAGASRACRRRRASNVDAAQCRSAAPGRRSPRRRSTRLLPPPSTNSGTPLLAAPCDAPRPRRRPSSARSEPARRAADAQRAERRERHARAAATHGSAEGKHRPSCATSAAIASARVQTSNSIQSPGASWPASGRSAVITVGDLRIAAGRLAIGHQQDRLARRRHLQRAGERGVRDHLATGRRAESRPPVSRYPMRSDCGGP